MYEFVSAYEWQFTNLQPSNRNDRLVTILLAQSPVAQCWELVES